LKTHLIFFLFGELGMTINELGPEDLQILHNCYRGYL